MFSLSFSLTTSTLSNTHTTSTLFQESLKFEYQPLHSGETTARLTMYNNELGSFQYELLLRAHPAPPEKPLYFRAPLGSGQYLTAKFISYSRVKTDYTCKVQLC